MDPDFQEPETAAAAIDPEAIKFYEQLAVVAAIEGVCIDLYAVGTRPHGLSCLAPLCEKTGGVLHYFAIADDAALPQDLYKRLQGPHAMAGLLRIRCCPELRIKQSYGRLFPDADHEQLYHLVSCDCKETLAFDLDYTSQTGFLSEGGNKMTHPVIQFAFQYSVLVPVAPETDKSGKPLPREASTPVKYEVQRRMRITTVAPRLAKTHEIVFNNAQVDTVAKVLMHKVLQCQLDEGAREARNLLQNWFVIMCSRYHHIVQQIEYGTTPHPGQIDVMLDKCEALAPMATLTYALLRSQLFGAAAGQPSDLTTYLKLLWCSLPPSELQRVLYPLLISFRTPDDKAHDRHLLSRATLQNNKHPILLLDAFHVMLIMYRANCPDSFPYPPPPESHLRESIQLIKKSRKISPKVKFCREGEADAAMLESFLIDEPQLGHVSDDAADAASLGFAKWIQHVQNACQKFIASQEAAQK